MKILRKLNSPIGNSTHLVKHHNYIGHGYFSKLADKRRTKNPEFATDFIATKLKRI